MGQEPITARSIRVIATFGNRVSLDDRVSSKTDSPPDRFSTVSTVVD